MMSSPSLAGKWPASALAIWALARGAGRCSADDVLQTLQHYSQVHEPDPGGNVLDLLALFANPAQVAVALPAPGDLQGLPPGASLGPAIKAGEMIVIDDRPPGSPGVSRPLTLVPSGTAERCRWQLMRYDVELAIDQLVIDSSLGELEYELREAMGTAAAVISRLGGVRPGSPVDVRDALAARIDAVHLDLPAHGNPRIDRVLGSVDQIEAIVSLVGSGALGDSGAQLLAADSQLLHLAALARRARSAAVNTLLREYQGQR